MIADVGIEAGAPLAADPSQRAGFVLLAAFLASFLFIRMSTRLMRSPRVPWWPGSVSTGGVHVHHLVFGIVLMIATGFVGFAVRPGSPWFEILAGGFGIGVGLTVDEFALWLYLEDVYWTEEGRSSVDVAIICAVVGALVLLGFVPFSDSGGSALGIVIVVLFELAFCAVVVAKGKTRLALIGLFIPLLLQVSAVRLARPNSWWARRRYPAGSRKLHRATARAARWDARRTRWLDRIGGAPHLVRAEKTDDTAGGEVLRGPGPQCPDPRSGGESEGAIPRRTDS
jgi:hypothetical protein